MDNLMGRYRNVSFLAAAIFLQILGLAVQVKTPTENKPTRLIRVWAVSTITPLEKGLIRLQSGAADLWHNYFYLRGVRQENRELRDEIEQLQLEQVRLKQDADQAHRLQKLLGFKEQCYRRDWQSHQRIQEHLVGAVDQRSAERRGHHSRTIAFAGSVKG
ncbi:MAG: hypothetical protein AUG89_05160 [Acidobacteria bacterium 13_1_20CM_4_56_7]|nr:MAG: hypothetical protein AUG89_05160 [Acidobacteria bacterium 13_1_20CM_4_56_7]